MKPLHTILITTLAGIIGSGCGSSESTTTTETTPPHKAIPVHAATTTAPAAQTADLNRQLAEKITVGSPDDIGSLLQRGATPEAGNRYGLPVIFLATQRGDTAILKLLIQAGADVNRQIGTSFNHDGVGDTGTADGTPLTYAAARGKLQVIKILTDAGADINGAGPEGTTALMAAAENNQTEAVKWLLANGATAGREKALGLARQFLNPDEAQKEMIRQLQGN